MSLFVLPSEKDEGRFYLLKNSLLSQNRTGHFVEPRFIGGFEDRESTDKSEFYEV